ncbi:MAG: GGDEF domain-containing protein [Candidatus Dormiibacterota bacterium]
MRESDTLARLGGDEFAVLLDGFGGAAQGAATAERIRAAFGDPFSIGNRSVQVGASIGMAVYPEGGRDAGAMIRTADAAMYVASVQAKATPPSWPSAVEIVVDGGGNQSAARSSCVGR